MITAIVSGTAVLLALIGGLILLSVKNADASTILSLVSTLIATATLIMQTATRAKVSQLSEQSNGTQIKLIDAAIAAPAPTNGGN